MATAVAVSLPWSTSATGVLVVLGLITLVPVLDGVAVRREVLSAAGGLPVLLWVLGVIGMLWADVSWSERIAGLSGFPGARGIWTTERRAPLQINSLGLRDVERKLAKPAGTLRIGLHGDSMVEGAQVSQEANFAALAERRLRAEGYRSS
jgi:hypothetical protein